MKKDSLILLILLIGIFIFNYSFFDSLLISAFDDYEYGIVERVIDGDTVVINSTSVRLLGINSPERGEVGYDEAKIFLEEEILGREVRLEFGTNKFDRYKRKLAYVFLGQENINLKSVKGGFSGFYFPSGKQKYYTKFLDAWNNCLEENTLLCEKSNDFCIKLGNWDIKNQEISIKNICSTSIDLTNWTIKDEGRKKFIFASKIINPFEEITITTEDFDEEYVWTKSGDSIFIRDSNNLLVIFETY